MKSANITKETLPANSFSLADEIRYPIKQNSVSTVKNINETCIKDPTLKQNGGSFRFKRSQALDIAHARGQYKQLDG